MADERAARAALDSAILALAGDRRSTPCTAADRGLWTSRATEDREAAAWRCGPCPILAACAAVGDFEPFGVWGGVDRSPRIGRPPREVAA
ncbi:WhiB family transcriptional regulator [Ammonicoccus fulvus]|uniref:WhiB family transcriptional regulator n=1 Tax=Ammonicoccus fulvus TaxID=3138240 RepID=A0ABZ3FWR2_9ACTN